MQKHSDIYLRKKKRIRRKEILYKKILPVAIATTVIVGVMALLLGKNEPQTEVNEETTTVQAEPSKEVYIEKTETVTKTMQIETPTYCFSANEEYLLTKIAMAEAGCEDTEGKALVILTVLNRVENENFPDTIEGVILQEGQFTPVSNGRYYSVVASEDCQEALDLVKSGWDESQDALYFERTTDSETWHSLNLDKLFIHGNHTFYTEGK